MIEISESVFEGCDQLESVIIQNSETTIGNYAFKNTKALKGIDLPSELTSINVGMFCGSGLESITIPPEVTTIGVSVFENCEQFESVIIPNDVTMIGDYAFKNCGNLTMIDLPTELTTLGDEVFVGTQLESIIIPSTVTTIGNQSFSGCLSLNSVTIQGTETPICETNVFSGIGAEYGDASLSYPDDHYCGLPLRLIGESKC